MYIMCKRFDLVSVLSKKFKRAHKNIRLQVICLLLVILIIFISSAVNIWTHPYNEADGYISNHPNHFQLAVGSRSDNRSKYEHHTQLESHRLQMLLLSKSSSKPELHQIMSKQSSVLHPPHLLKGKEEIPYKKILYWPPVFTMNKAFPKLYGLGVGRDVYRRAGCPVWQCETSQDRSNLSQYDAILFHYLSYQGWISLPEKRYSHQRYVFFETEPQNFNRSSWGFLAPDMMKDLFNWTMTFRWDSDVVHPYGWIEPMGSVPLHPNQEEYERLVAEPSVVNYSAGKTKFAAWMVTNCEASSGRNDLIIQLIEQGIEVDVYGACGNLTCGVFEYHVDGKSKTDDTDEPCREMISAKYKFYFALENALCIDYVTEKFYTLMRFPIVLVVMDAHGNHAKAAPPHSYINALDFPSTRALADYLIKLDGDDQLYNEYFWWKKHFTVKNSLLSGIFYNNFCNLCAALHDPLRQGIKKTYPDMIKWWISDSQCKRASFSGIYTY